MITLQAYQDYFEQFKASGLVQSIYQIDLLDLDTARAAIAKLQEPVLVVEDFSVATQGKDADHLIDRYIAAVVVLKKASLRGSTESNRKQVLQETFDISRQIKQQLIRDYNTGIPVITHLKPATFQLDKIGPALDNRYGYRLQFEIHERLIY